MLNVAALYLWIKALHLASVMLFVAGVLAQAWFISAVQDRLSSDAAKAAMTKRFQQTERHFTLPAMLVLLASGVTIASIGKWFPSAWLIVKLVLVTTLLAIHGFQSGQLRRAANGKAITSRNLQYVVLGVASIIAILAVVKP